MDAIKRVVCLESISTKNLKTPCKILGYVNMIVYGCSALINHIQGIVIVLMQDNWHPRTLLYVSKEIEESWMVCRAVFAFFLIKGVREDNPGYVLPLFIDASTQILALLIFVLLEPFSKSGHLASPAIIRMVASFIMDVLVLTMAGNYFRRLRRGNLEAESDQQNA
ncbi:hypothetical protein GE061_012933 [Apolygus lucorum]|uniref:Uncharacterized protein n=1 Tax=Apolygus lucorum TaxID=248454 RepID=A0A8S9XVS1_APOLU|nr:hypothetical protein GE061_012933 [Apolygus lucorum]